MFIGGERIYPTSGFFQKTHIQICVCDPDMIEGGGVMFLIANSGGHGETTNNPGL